MPMIDADGCPIHVAVDGRDSGPTVIFSNSLGATIDMWEPQRAALGSQFRVIRYDRRAFSPTRYHTAWRERVQGDKQFDLNTVSPLYATDRINILLVTARPFGEEGRTAARVGRRTRRTRPRWSACGRSRFRARSYSSSR